MHPPDAPPEPAARPAVPRFERVAAGVLVPVYALIWVPMWIYGNLGWRGLYIDFVVGRTSATDLLGDPNLLNSQRCMDIAFGVISGLIAATFALAGQGIIRLAGRQGLLRGRSFWWWVVCHGAVGLVGWEGIAVAQWRLYGGEFFSNYDYFTIPAFLVPLCIACTVLYATRKPPCNP